MTSIHCHMSTSNIKGLCTNLFETGELLKGQLPRKAAVIVKEWCLQHQAELMQNWQKAQKFEPLERIQGADQDD